MTEAEIIEAIGEEVAKHESATPAALRLVEQGVKQYPASASLWMIRGDLIQVSDDDGRYSLDDALESYRTALALEPSRPEVHESIGHYLDAVAEKPAEAEAYFRKALDLGGGKSAREGLAQVLEQLGKAD